MSHAFLPGSLSVTSAIVQDWVSHYEDPSFYQWAIVLSDGESQMPHNGLRGVQPLRQPPNGYDGVSVRPAARGNQPIGCIGVNTLDEKTRKAHIGYCLAKAYWHQGIMSEAFAAIIDFLFEKGGLNRIESMHDPNNSNSGSVMKKCGLTYEGTLRSADFSNQGICDAAYYGILREDWICRKALEQWYGFSCTFRDFLAPDEMDDGELRLVCENKEPADPQKGWVPYYRYRVCLHNEPVGTIDLRLGYDENLFYSGNIGYAIDEPYRGNGYAARACRLLVPAAKAHDMKVLGITNNPANTASFRVCEKLGARFIGKAVLPESHSMYSETRRYSNIFFWDIR